MRVLPVLLLGVQTYSVALAQQPLPADFTMFIDSATVVQLDTLADTATVEHGECLYGTISHDTIWLESAFARKLRQATAVNLNPVGTCPGQALAFWHNHIPQDYTILGQHQPAKPPPQYCYLSRSDMTSAADPREPPLQFVGVGQGYFCWWTQAEITRRRAKAEQDGAMIPADGHLAHLTVKPAPP